MTLTMYQCKKVRTLRMREFNHRYVLSLDNHVSIAEALTAFCNEKHITAGTVSGIGAISSATFRFLDPVTK